MKVSQAIETRISCRAFLDKEPSEAVVRKIITQAKRAPSGGNLQPWHLHVVRGEKLKTLSEAVLKEISGDVIKKTNHRAGAEMEYNVYPPELSEPYKARRARVGEMMYALLDIPREDKAGRVRQFVANYEFFGAPVGLFFSMDRTMGSPQWSDVGMLMQSICLLAREEGLHTCPQECWATFAPIVRRVLEIPDHHIFFCGMSLGYMDEAAPINQLKTERVDEDEFATFMGFAP